MKSSSYFFSLLFFFLFGMITFGQFWQIQTSGTTQHLTGVYMIDAQNGWICGDGGTLLKTNNGGQTWTPVNVTNKDLNAIVFIDANIGIVVGEDGLVIRTSDGGVNWNPVNSGTNLQLRSIDKGNGNFLFAAGDDGTAIISIDGGINWIPGNSGIANRFRGAAAVGSDKLYAVGEDGIIRHSPNGGQTWVNQSSGLTQELHDVQFVNENIGFASGSGSNFIYTNNGGQTWLPRNSGIFFGLNGLYFFDELRGWAVADIGTVFITSDAGVNWLSQPCGSAFTLREVYFIHPGKGWSVGDNGTILMYTDDSVPVELNSFSASVSGKDVNLIWSTASETNNRGFEIERKQNTSNWNLIGFVNGKGTSTEKQDYNFLDKNLPSGTYQYRLKQIDFDGTFEYYDLSAEVEINTIENFSLEQNYPNPFNPSTSISFNIPQDGFVNLKVYNVLGNEVAVLISKELSAGNHTMIFDAVSLSSGIYYYRLEVNNEFIGTKQMVLLK